MKKYLVVRSFASAQIGAHSEGDVIQLTEEQARGVSAFLKPVQPEGKTVSIETEIVETADLPLEAVETAVKKIKKGKKV